MTFPLTVLPLRVELLGIVTADVWTDITEYVQRRDGGISITRGRSDETSALQPSKASLNLDNRDGRFSPRNPNGAYYGKLGRNTPIRCSIVGPTYLRVETVPGLVGGVSVSTPDTAALDITGDIDLRFDGDLHSWWIDGELVGKWETLSDERSYVLGVDSGYLTMRTSSNGTAVILSTSTIPLPIAHGRITVRATVDVNNGASGNTVTFYTAPDGVDGTFTQLGDVVVNSGTTSIFSSTADLYVLDNQGGDAASGVSSGRVYAAQVRSSIAGTVVANPDFTIQTAGATSFADSTGKTWTLSGTVSLDDRDYRFYGEVAAFPQLWDTTGSDVWVPIEANGVTRRLSQGAKDLRSPVFTGTVGQADVVAYWPCEDQSGSEFVASTLPGGFPMRGNGPTDYAAETGFACAPSILKFGFSNLSGKVADYTATGHVQLQFLMHVPDAGTGNNSVIARILCGGTAPRWDLEYGTGGTLQLIAYNSDAGVIADSGAIGFAVNGEFMRVSIELTQDGTGVDWAITTLVVGDTLASTSGGTLASRTVTKMTAVKMNALGGLSDVGCGHITAYSSFVNIFDLAAELNAYVGETAGDRIIRLLGENNLDYESRGNISDTPLMGAQGISTLLDLIGGCVDVDQGMLYEARDSLNLGYLPATAIYGQPADLELAYSSNQLSEMAPVEDDQAIRNDVTVTRTGGTSARVALETGPLSTQAPPGGVGTYDTAVTLNLHSDDQAQHHASWRVRVGTVDEARWPTIAVNLAHPEFFDNALAAAALGVDVGGRLTISGLPAWVPPDDVSALVQGYTEFLSNFEHTLTFTCTPSSPLDTAGHYAPTANDTARYSSDGSTLAEDMTTTETGMDVSTPSGPLWITTALVPDDFPFDIRVGGEQMTVTAVTGTSSPQTFTVTRSVNGVVKTHATGATVELFAPAYYVI